MFLSCQEDRFQYGTEEVTAASVVRDLGITHRRLIFGRMLR